MGTHAENALAVFQKSAGIEVGPGVPGRPVTGTTTAISKIGRAHV